MFCPNCGEKQIDASFHCRACGQRICEEITVAHHSAALEALGVLGLLLFMGSLVTGLVFMAAYLVRPDDAAVDPHDIALLVWGMAISFAIVPVSGIVGLLSFIGLRRQRTQCRVVPLLAVGIADFILCKEGLYANTVPAQFRPRWKGEQAGFYDFHPWSSLCMYTVDDSESTIGLKSSGDLLKLRADDFDEMKGMVLSRVKQPCDRSGEIPVRIAKFVAGLLALIVLQVVLHVLLPKPTLLSDAPWYLFTHPLLSLRVLIASDTEGVLRLMAALSLLPWGWSLYDIVKGSLVSPWSKARTLDQ